MDIDVVVLWVDGNDSEWKTEKMKYQGNILDESNSSNRFRDWGIMPYWFRAIEQFCPWVRKIHFVTCGHVPEWLDLNCPKLNHVKHSDFIPHEYLPTFNANAIEMNIHRISGLAEHFVFFNDDMFILRSLKGTAFFQNELPCIYGGEEPIVMTGQSGIWQHLIINDMRVINNHFDKRKQVKCFGEKYVNKKYRWKDNIRTKILEKLYPTNFLGFKNIHAPASLCKSTFEEIWKKEEELLKRTCSHRFRSNDDVNQWLVLWWQIASGHFYPYNTDNIVDDVNENTIGELSEIIKGQLHDMICVNDPNEEISFEELSSKMKDSFNSILPKKSIYEK